MIKLTDILNELEINNPINHNKWLLNFLQKHKDEILPIILEDEEVEDDDEQYESTDEFYDQKFEEDDNGNPSIGNGWEYFSFSLKKEELMGKEAIVDKFKFKNITIYYIHYSI